MWIVRWLLIGIIFLVVLVTTLQNSQLIVLEFFGWQSSQMPIYLVTCFAFAAGMVVILLISAYHQLQRQFEIGRCRKQIKRLQNELEALKSESADENDYPSENGITSSKETPE